jgi:hypothetical protein
MSRLDSYVLPCLGVCLFFLTFDMNLATQTAFAQQSESAATERRTDSQKTSDSDSKTAAKKLASADGKDFKLVKKDFLRKARSKKARDRISAVKMLDDFPSLETAELVWQMLLDDHDSDVRTAAIQLLAELSLDSKIATKVLQKSTAATRKEGMNRRALAALRALGGSEDPEVQILLVKYLNEFLGTARVDQYLLHETIDELAQNAADADFMRLLLLFARTDFFERDFGFRRCVVQGLAEVKDPDAMTRLINLLPRLNGQVQFDVVSHLMHATGQNFGADAGQWLKWWIENKGKPIVSENTKSKVPAISNYGKFGEYHGIPICAKRVVFVLDTSRSMQGGKIQRAQTELTRTIDELPHDVHFSIVFFDGTVRVWQHELVPASEQMKRIAKLTVQDQSLGANTASYDALEAAFELQPEAIYFLSDGEPVGGKVNNPTEIVSIFSAMNRVRRVSIHSIGVDTNLPGAEIFGRFMKSLAVANWGVYQAVN